MKITLVKKILADGTFCRKCIEVESRLNDGGHMHRIDSVVIADERDLASEGMELAKKHNVTLAPFFIVENSQGSIKIYTVYFKFLKEILNTKPTEAEEISDIMDNNPDLDYI
ncbi:MAG: hypothetical protein ACI9XC_000934 [Gammaproteobacteria bacterium]|jgi:hypothetical protein